MRTRSLFLVALAVGGGVHAARRFRSALRDMQSTIIGSAHPRMPAEGLAPARSGTESVSEQLAPALDVLAEVPDELVHAERELLTVPGDDGHRLRDQTRGVEAREIAAAQVRSRRNAHDDLDLDFD